jgi:hypothetical protein
MTVKLIAEQISGRLLGAQIVGTPRRPSASTASRSRSGTA